MDKTPKVLGIIGIVLGSVSIPGSVLGLFAASLYSWVMDLFTEWVRQFPRRPGQDAPDPGQAFAQYSGLLEAIKPYQVAQSAMMLVLSLVLVVLCIAVLQRRPWSRKAAMGWAVVALASIPVMIWIQVFVIQPLAQQTMLAPLQQQAGAGQAADVEQFVRFMQSFQSASAAVGTLSIYAPFPAVLFALLKRQKSKAWFAPARDDGPAAP